MSAISIRHAYELTTSLGGFFIYSLKSLKINWGNNRGVRPNHSNRFTPHTREGNQKSLCRDAGRFFLLKNVKIQK